MTDETLTDPADYRIWTREKIRWQDVDQYGHVNNVAFSVYAESGRVEFLERIAPGSVFGDGPNWVIVRLVVDFREQAHYPGEVRIGTRVTRVGRSSATLVQGLFEGERCFATSEAVVVLMDPETGRSVPIPDSMRSALEQS
ncbi:MAG: thioesterase family protein [Ectothiorhodospiraceae bacterium]|jgi:acyl-CoA thioester hydrolase